MRERVQSQPPLSCLEKLIPDPFSSAPDATSENCSLREVRDLGWRALREIPTLDYREVRAGSLQKLMVLDMVRDFFIIGPGLVVLSAWTLFCLRHLLRTVRERRAALWVDLFLGRGMVEVAQCMRSSHIALEVRTRHGPIFASEFGQTRHGVQDAGVGLVGTFSFATDEDLGAYNRIGLGRGLGKDSSSFSKQFHPSGHILVMIFGASRPGYTSQEGLRIDEKQSDRLSDFFYTSKFMMSSIRNLLATEYGLHLEKSPIISRLRNFKHLHLNLEVTNFLEFLLHFKINKVSKDDSLRN
ncbi:hypothetical protein HYFRA_00006965 [Hymenoscyphus fraxineus]|uniref:Uncharacterized protein n=1 Tax=Hymenoscyphus fraxineus TaxID=746836 RepID=A0A9N9KNA0_9HELO|nr:hypothetical protein HYFRA_00006965 [Hymenoscyphus fraxineus]